MAETSTVPMVYVRCRELPVGASRGVVGLDEVDLTPFDWEGEVATEITDYDVQCMDGMKGSIDSVGMAGLFNKYMLTLLEKHRPTAEEQILFENVFGEKGRGYGNFVNTLVNYNDHCDDQGKELEPRKGFARASVILKPKDFRYSDKKQAEFELDENSKIVRGVYVPGEGFMALTEKGLLNPRTGLPYLTVGSDRDRSVESFTARGFPRDFAEMIASYFFPRGEGQGVGAVWRRFWLGDFGRFSLDAVYNPAYRFPAVGRLASRSPSGARPASENGVESGVLGSVDGQIEIVTEAQYKERIRVLEEDNRKLKTKADFVDGLAEQLRPLLGKA